MPRLLFVLLLVAAGSLAVAAGLSSYADARHVPALVRARVLAVTDGDTILRAVVNDRNERIRLIGVDAPEIEYEAQPGGQEAQKFARARLTQRTVWLEMDVLERDHHGRLLAYVWLRRLTLVNEALVRRHMFNAQLLLEGHAQAVTIPPNVRYSGMFAEFQQEAEAAEKEMWKKR